MQSLNYQITTLDNGIRVITEQVNHVQFLSMGIWVNVGSRYETPEEWGITHFIEHMLFKGTEKRTAEQISEAIDGVGGQINAFTSKECTCYYVKLLSENFDLGVDVLTDMFLNSKFDNKEIEKEREVIIEEIKMYEDTPDDLVQDLLSVNIWPDHPLGRQIIGSEESLAAFDHDALHNYQKKYYTGSNIVVSVVGNISHETVVEAVKKTLGHVPMGEVNRPVLQENSITAGVNCVQKDIAQSQICLAMQGLPRMSDDLFTVSLLNTYLGGGMSSRLVKKIREEEGLAYSVYAYHGTYNDTGAFVVYAGTRPDNTQTVVDMILAELEDVRKNGIQEDELVKVKQQMKGNLFMSLETVSSRMNKLGRSLLLSGVIETPEEQAEKLSKVTAEDIKAMAENMFRKEAMQLTVLGAGKEITLG